MADTDGFKPYFTDSFSRILNKLDGSVKGRIQEQIDAIIENPLRKTIPYGYDLKGKRKKRAGNMRVVFAICKECRQMGHVSLNSCIDCSEKGDDSIVFFDVGFRGGIYD